MDGLHHAASSGLFGVLTLATGAVGDAFETAWRSAQGCRHRPVDLVRVGVEMIRAEGLQAREHLIDLGFFGHKGAQGGFAVAPGLVGAQLVAGCGDQG